MSMFDENDLQMFSVRESIPLVFELDERYNWPVFQDQITTLILFVKEEDKFLINAFIEAGRQGLGHKHRFTLNTLKNDLQISVADQCGIIDGHNARLP